MKRVTVKVPDKLHLQFKLVCMASGRTVSEQIRIWMEAEVQRSKPKVLELARQR